MCYSQCISFLSFLCVASSMSPPVAPNVTAISKNQTVTSPDSVSFSCTVDSYPSSTVTWLHNGAEVQVTPPRVNISTVQLNNRTQESNLTLLSTTSEDIGTYTCSAVNAEGSTYRTTELRVLGEGDCRGLNMYGGKRSPHRLYNPVTVG